jgi:hypothetical protein
LRKPIWPWPSARTTRCAPASLLEGSLSDWPGAALPALADMLIKGEGGPADPKRALKLLQRHSNKSAAAPINAALGKLYIEGKLVPRDLQKAEDLISNEVQWSVEAKLYYARFLTDYPTVKSYDATRFLYKLTDIAELATRGDDGADRAEAVAESRVRRQDRRLQAGGAGCGRRRRKREGVPHRMRRELTRRRLAFRLAPYPFLPSARMVGRPMPVASNPPSTDSNCPVM